MESVLTEIGLQGRKEMHAEEIDGWGHERGSLSDCCYVTQVMQDSEHGIGCPTSSMQHDHGDFKDY
jgi:hypothetical protein